MGTTPESIRSFRTDPGPTDGNWSTSPTSMRAASGGTASIRLYAKGRSIMLTSSAKTTSASRGWSALRLKARSEGSNSRSLWMVFAPQPVVSVIRLAARPVGAHSRHSRRLAVNTLSMLLTMVVLPTPGPPVMTSTFS